MATQVRVVRVVQAGSEGASRAWRSVQAQPSWISRLVGAVFLFVLVLPLLLLFLLALAAAVLLFVVLAVVNTIIGAVRGVLPERHARTDGRSNVRVIDRGNG